MAFFDDMTEQEIRQNKAIRAFICLKSMISFSFEAMSISILAAK